jgi:hypothetical protein
MRRETRRQANALAAQQQLHRQASSSTLVGPGSLAGAGSPSQGQLPALRGGGGSSHTATPTTTHVTPSPSGSEIPMQRPASRSRTVDRPSRGSSASTVAPTRPPTRPSQATIQVIPASALDTSARSQGGLSVMSGVDGGDRFSTNDPDRSPRSEDPEEYPAVPTIVATPNHRRNQQVS